ncbi:MAG TPA: zinc ribbon domain-containing protein [Candidatus Acidoferrum sp.]|jgi:putative FmdB family regulatory protein|nr:zinc ribbon domain-containing protein [Candidatus Acidoferrum sp.]
MPIYEYRCASCDRSFEAFVRPGDDGAQCPHCRGSKLTREMSTFAARSSNGDAASAAASAIADSGTSNTGGGCCGGGCGCH